MDFDYSTETITPDNGTVLNVAGTLKVSVALSESASTAVAAAGITQGTATTLTSVYNIVTSATAGSAIGVIIPSVAGSPVGVKCVVVNKTSVTISIYPPVGGTVGGGVANASINLGPGATITLVSTSVGYMDWIAVTPALVAGSNITLDQGNGYYTINAAGGSTAIRGCESWTTVTAPITSTSWRGMAYGNGTVVMLDGGAGSTVGMYSKNGGESWTAITMPATMMWIGCAYGNGIFVTTGAMTSNSVATSPDGITWTNQSAVLPDTNTHSFVTYANGAFYIASYNTTTISRSYNGVQWFQSTLPTYAAWQGGGGGDGVVVIVAGNTTAAVRSVDGGATFSSITMPASLDWRAVAYGNGVFIAVASTASNSVAARSVDGGATWTSFNLPTAQTWCDVTYANGMFVAISNDGYGAKSTDGGITWTSFAMPFIGTYQIIFGDGRFITGGDATNTAYSLAGGSNYASGNIGSIMYSDNGGLNAAQGAGIVGENLWIAPSNVAGTPSRGLTLFGREFGPPNGGRTMLAVVGPSGMDYPLQPSLWRQAIGFWRPPGNATTVPGVFGLTAPTAGGTATARNVATTNALTRTKRLGYVSSTTAGTYGGHYITNAQWTLGTGILGGFFYSCRFGVSDATIQTVARTFVGMSSNVAAPTNVDPATLTNSIGIGCTASDTTWYIYYGGSTAQTRISLGSNFPINNTDVIDITLWSPPNQTGVVYYHVTRIATTSQYEATGKLGQGTSGVTLPATTTLLTHRAWRGNNTAAAAVGIDIVSIYIETDW